MKETLKMSLKEAERLAIMKQTDKNILNIREASKELGVCLRQTKRVRKRYVIQGAEGLISLKRGRKSNRKIDTQIKNKVIGLVKSKYSDFGPTFACEKLKEVHNIKISDETLRKWLIEEGIWKPKKQRKGKVYQRRERRSRFGELVQGDGSPHDWFEGRSEKCTLLQFVDDATSRTTVALFMPTETTNGYLELLKEHLNKYGRPLAFYVDKHSVFRVNREELQKGIGITHFGRVVKELEIELICAHSPQAKGRVERKNGLFQDRLIKEMRLRGINTIEEGNNFLPEFLEDINRRFEKEPANREDAHRNLRPKDELERIFARKETRKLSKNLTFQYKGTLYMLETKTPNRLRGATLDIICKEGKPIELEYKGKGLKYKKWTETIYEKPKVLDYKEIALNQWATKTNTTPRKNHPWR
jgi:hypothetical protein